MSAAAAGTVTATGTGLHVRRPSVSSRLSFAVSTAERGENDEGAPAAAAEHQRIEEEIAEIKRYEDFTTIGAS